eukprot:CAMPEP_0171305684 /NCGR_PEP_ID=MMETSP0816-20121228/15544_1 /TAXON_ID=420281 /ORGANISM="Proboscia inermis, Strain CCAP1064/1" /LENGTH=110 /DNA_ID=CAMNT_0011786685 /DNA_START=509 /DNA_END=844 /DNA_ORIENTATION=+
MGDFIRGEISGEITEVPGIGPAAAKKLAESDDQVTNTYQLFGKFLSLKGPDKVDPVEHMEKFWYWLKDQGISAHRSAVVRAIAEKMNSMMNGLYDAEAYGDDDDDDDEEE